MKKRKKIKKRKKKGGKKSITTNIIHISQKSSLNRLDEQTICLSQNYVNSKDNSTQIDIFLQQNNQNYIMNFNKFNQMEQLNLKTNIPQSILISF